MLASPEQVADDETGIVTAIECRQPCCDLVERELTTADDDLIRTVHEGRLQQPDSHPVEMICRLVKEQHRRN